MKRHSNLILPLHTRFYGKEPPAIKVNDAATTTSADESISDCSESDLSNKKTKIKEIR